MSTIYYVVTLSEGHNSVVCYAECLLQVLLHAEYYYAEYHYAEDYYAEYHYPKYHYAEYHYAEYHYAEYHYAKYRYTGIDTECHYVEWFFY